MALFRTGGGASAKKTAAFTGYNEGSSYYMYGVDNSGNSYPSANTAFTVTDLANVGAGTSSRVVTALVPLTVYIGDIVSGSGVTQHLNANETYTFSFGSKTLLLVED